MVKKLKWVFVFACVGLCSCAQSYSSSMDEEIITETPKKWEEKTVDVFTPYSTEKRETKLYFPDNIKNIPYFNTVDLGEFWNQMYVVNTNDGISTIVRYAWDTTDYSNAPKVTIDSKENKITVSDYYEIFVNDSTNSINTHVPDCFQKTSLSYESNSVTLNLDNYKLKIFRDGDKVLVPAQTMFDLFTTSYQYAYNGNGIYAIEDIYEDNSLTEYGARFKNISEDYVYDAKLRNFAYHELCLSLDYLYALKDMRNYPSFETLLVEKGIKAKIYENGILDPNKFDKALNELFNVVLDDNGHTGFGDAGSNVFNRNTFGGITMGETAKANMSLMQDITGKKKSKYNSRNLIEDYVSSDKTYVISFDDFGWIRMDEQGKYILDGEQTSATFVNKANDYIQKHMNDVDNIILDLSSNGGGQDYGRIQLECWLLGEYTEYQYGPIANGKGSSTYKCDVNLDGNFDSKDTVRGKNIYVLTSNVSYSNGNIVPGELKGLNNVTIIGQKTTGGSCNTVQFSTTLGNIYSLSSNTRSVNSKWESLELGVATDKELTDTNKLTDYRYIIDTYIKK